MSGPEEPGAGAAPVGDIAGASTPVAPRRRWPRRILLALLLLPVGVLVAENLALNTPFAWRALHRHPERFRLDWRAAWTVVPGHIHLRGLALEGRTGRVAWSIGADRAVAVLDLRALLDRRLRVSELRCEGVRSSLSRPPPLDGPAAPPARSGAPRRPGARRPWTFDLERVVLRHVRLLRFGNFRIVGDGEVEGALRIVPGGDLWLRPTRLHVPSATVARGPRTLASSVDLRATASLGPYARRQHPGLQGWDFLAGTLTAHGRVDDLPLLQRVTGAQPPAPGTLALALIVDGGRLRTGSRATLTAPSSRPGSSLTARAEVVPGGAGPLLRLRLEGRGVSAGRAADGRPAVRLAALTLTTTTPETRLRGLAEAVRRRRADAAALRTGTSDPAGAAPALPASPLFAEVRATGVEVDAPSSRLALRATLDRAVTRIDLAALFAREIAVEGLEVEGAVVRLDLQERPPAPPRPGRRPWSVRVDGARLRGIREIALGELVLAGEGSAEASLTLDPAGNLDVPRAVLDVPAGSLAVGGAPAAHDLALALDARLAPVRTGPGRGDALLRATSGTATLRGKVASLGFLEPYLKKTPWLALQGKGTFTADLRLEGGRFAIPSRLVVDGSPVVATILGSQANGRGTVEVAVEPAKAGPHTVMRVRFDRFGLVDLRRVGHPPYLRGRGLRILAVAAAPIDLTDPVQDFDATLDLPDGELPDLAVYNSLLPAEAGLSLLAGHGKARLHLQASTFSRRATGSAAVTAEGVRLRFQNVELAGRLVLRAPLASPDLITSRFDLAGTRLDLEGIAWRDAEAAGVSKPGWWAHAELAKGSLTWGDPLALRGEGTVRMKDSAPLVALFAQKSRLLRWLEDALSVEDVRAEGVLRLDKGLVAVDSLRATGGSLEVRSRMVFRKGSRHGDLYLRYGVLAAGIALRDGKRDIVLRKPLEWFEGGAKGWGRP